MKDPSGLKHGELCGFPDNPGHTRFTASSAWPEYCHCYRFCLKEQPETMAELADWFQKNYAISDSCCLRSIDAVIFFFRKCSSNTGVERGACCDWIPNITGRVMITNPLEGWAEEVDLTALDALLTTLSLNDCPLVCPFRTAMGDLAMAAGRRHQTEDKAAAAFRVAIGAEPTRQEAKAGTFANSYNLEQKPVATVGPQKIEPCPTWRGTTSGSASEIPSARRLH